MYYDNIMLYMLLLVYNITVYTVPSLYGIMSNDDSETTVITLKEIGRLYFLIR